jgi:hypothetical protein
MRSGGNFSPEWGYLAPAPSFARTARVVLVATAIGATAGAGVVLSLIDRPSEPQQVPIAARAIVTSVRAAAVPSVSPAAPVTAAAPPTTATVPQSPAAAAKPGPQPAATAAAPPVVKPDNSIHASARAVPRSEPATIAPANSATTAPVGVPAANPNLNPAPAANQIASAPAAAVGDATAGVAAAPATASAGEPAALPTAPGKADGTPADASNNTTIMAPEPAVPPKKTKRQGSSKPAPFAGIGSMLRRAFASHPGRSYYPQ